MSIVITTDVFCDGEGCSQWAYGETGPKPRSADARKNAARQGWKISKSGDFCPDCARKRQWEIMVRKDPTND